MGAGAPASGEYIGENPRERLVFPIAYSKEAQTGRGRNNNKPIDRCALRVTQLEAWRASIPQLSFLTLHGRVKIAEK